MINRDYKNESAWIGLPAVEGFAPSNTSVVVYDDELLFQTRYVSYTKHLASELFNPYGYDCNQNYRFDSPYYESRNYRWGVGQGRFEEVVYPSGEDVMFRGLEDARMVVWNNELYTYGTRCDKAGGDARIVLYTPSGEEVVVRSPFGCAVEKNWMAIPDRPMHFVYGFRDYKVVVVKVCADGSCEVLENDGAVNMDWYTAGDVHFNDIRGGTPLVRIENGYLAVVHRQEWTYGGYCYRHAVVRFDDRLNLVDITRWFQFMHPVCEFCTGMALKDGKVYLTYSVLDCVPMLMEFTLEGLLSLFGNDDFDTDATNVLYWEGVMANLYNGGQVRSAGVLANWFMTLGYDTPDLLAMYQPLLSVEDYMKIKYRK